MIGIFLLISIVGKVLSQDAATCDPEHAKVCTNLCSTLVCNIAPRATCVMNNCGRCEVEFYVNMRKILCDSVSTRFEIDVPDGVEPPLTAVEGSVCPRGVKQVRCVINPCDRATCPRYPNAQCRLNSCGRCAAEFFEAGTNKKLDCRRKENIGLCPKLNCNQHCPLGRVRDATNCETCICKTARF